MIDITVNTTPIRNACDVLISKPNKGNNIRLAQKLMPKPIVVFITDSYKELSLVCMFKFTSKQYHQQELAD